MKFPSELKVIGAVLSAFPSAQQVKDGRAAAGITQVRAAELCHANLRTWQTWEYGTAKMHPSTWELFCMKTGSVYVTNDTESVIRQNGTLITQDA